MRGIGAQLVTRYARKLTIHYILRFHYNSRDGEGGLAGDVLDATGIEKSLTDYAWDQEARLHYRAKEG